MKKVLSSVRNVFFACLVLLSCLGVVLVFVWCWVLIILCLRQNLVGALNILKQWTFGVFQTPKILQNVTMVGVTTKLVLVTVFKAKFSCFVQIPRALKVLRTAAPQ